jgi:hypothetical protein
MHEAGFCIKERFILSCFKSGGETIVCERSKHEIGSEAISFGLLLSLGERFLHRMK